LQLRSRRTRISSVDTPPIIAAKRRPIAALRPLVSWSLRLRALLSTGSRRRNCGFTRLLAALLITLAGISGGHEEQPASAGQLNVSMTSPITSDADLLALAAGTVEVLDDGVDIHLALRGKSAVPNAARASLVAKRYADTVALTVPRLPERPPRIA
jgi:hypothetical protein